MFIGHITRHNTYIANTIEGGINSKKGRRQPKNTNVENIKKYYLGQVIHNEEINKRKWKTVAGTRPLNKKIFIKTSVTKIVRYLNLVISTFKTFNKHIVKICLNLNTQKQLFKIQNIR